MASRLPHSHKFEIRQPLAAADTARVDALDGVIILLPESGLQKHWPDFAHSERLHKRLAGKKTIPPTRVDLPNTRGTTAVVASYKPETSAFERLTLARKCVTKLRESEPEHMGLILPAADKAEHAELAEAMVSAVAASNFDAPQFKAKRGASQHIASLTLFGGRKKQDFTRSLAEAEGNALARWLTLLPANKLTPTEYHGYIKELAKREGWKFEFLDEDELKEIGAGAFLAVCRGSDVHDAGIAHLSYRPTKKPRSKHAVTLVGKGICYDTGGVNLKSAKSMFGMHGDMQGSAVALGTLLALSRLKVPFKVDAWLAIARNQIGPKAYTQNEVVQSFLPHVSIEIVHTDAEGRMVLSDTLALSMSSHPEIVVDYATLTGSCITALGTRYSGAFTRDGALAKAVLKAGIESGERVWPMPVDEDYDEDIESNVADVKQCIIESQADHILAARFLSRFVPPACPWVHVDLAAAEHKGGLAHIPTDVTGFGVRFSLNLFLDQGLAPR